jgi:hypothetical protein
MVHIFANAVRLEEAERPDSQHRAVIVGVVMRGCNFVRMEILGLKDDEVTQQWIVDRAHVPQLLTWGYAGSISQRMRL